MAETTLASLRVEAPRGGTGVLLEDTFEPFRLQFFNKALLGYVCPELKTLVSTIAVHQHLSSGIFFVFSHFSFRLVLR